MPRKTNQDESLVFRLSKSTKQRFITKIKRIGAPSMVLREIVEAYVDDRLVIHPPKDKESLYVTRSET